MLCVIRLGKPWLFKRGFAEYCRLTISTFAGLEVEVSDYNIVVDNKAGCWWLMVTLSDSSRSLTSFCQDQEVKMLDNHNLVLLISLWDIPLSKTTDSFVEPRPDFAAFDRGWQITQWPRLAVGVVPLHHRETHLQFAYYDRSLSSTLLQPQLIPTYVNRKRHLRKITSCVRIVWIF